MFSSHARHPARRTACGGKRPEAAAQYERLVIEGGIGRWGRPGHNCTWTYPYVDAEAGRVPYTDQGWEHEQERLSVIFDQEMRAVEKEHFRLDTPSG